MPRMGFELTIPVFERAKIVHALDLAATMIGNFDDMDPLNKQTPKCLNRDVC
jgi:putative methionine-R-sulfoxide reductase with GAF domain